MAGEPSDLLFYATFNTTTDADFTRLGNPFPLNNNGDSIDSGVKNCGAGSVHFSSAPGFVRYSGGGEVVQTGTISLYAYIDSSAPSTSIFLFDLNSWTTGDGEIQIFVNRGSGDAVCYIEDSSGIGIVSITAFSAFSLDTWHHVELDFDITGGATRLFIDGTQVGGTKTNTGNRSVITNYLDIGHYSGSGKDFYIDDVQVYNTVRHTTNFSPACGLLPDLVSPGLVTFGYPFGLPSKRGFTR